MPHLNGHTVITVPDASVENESGSYSGAQGEHTHRFCAGLVSSAKLPLREPAAFASDSSTTAQFHRKRKQMILERLDVTVGLTGEFVESYEFTDRPIDVRWQRHFLPYRVFDKESAREYRCCRRKLEAGLRDGSCESEAGSQTGWHA
jgi:hypothetical protein